MKQDAEEAGCSRHRSHQSHSLNMQIFGCVHSFSIVTYLITETLVSYTAHIYYLSFCKSAVGHISAGSSAEGLTRLSSRCWPACALIWSLRSSSRLNQIVGSSQFLETARLRLSAPRGHSQVTTRLAVSSQPEGECLSPWKDAFKCSHLIKPDPPSMISLLINSELTDLGP